MTLVEKWISYYLLFNSRESRKEYQSLDEKQRKRMEL